MDPVAAVAQGVGSIFNFFTSQTAKNYARLPEWQRPQKDQDNRANTLIIFAGIAFLAIVFAIIVSLSKSKK